MSGWNQVQTVRLQEKVDEREFLRFLSRVVARIQIPVEAEVRRISANPSNPSPGEIADHINYSPLSPEFAGVTRSIWEEIRRDSPFPLNGGLSPVLVQLLFRVILQIDLLAEVFRGTTGSIAREDLILTVLFNEILLLNGATDARHDLRDIVKFSHDLGKERLGKEVLLGFRAKYGWKAFNPAAQDALNSSLYGSSIFIHLRQTGMLCKFLFNDGRISAGELSDLKDFRQTLLQKLLRALISMAHADGRLSTQEKEFLPAFCEQFDLAPPTLEFHEFDPGIVEELKGAFPSADQKAFFLACLRDVQEADGETDEVENAFLNLLTDSA